jgi:flagellar export protein FliJ
MAGRELLGHIAKDVEKKRQTLVEAARKKKTYEKLKERHLQQYTEDSNLALQKENDEIGQKMFVYNR